MGTPEKSLMDQLSPYGTVISFVAGLYSENKSDAQGAAVNLKLDQILNEQMELRKRIEATYLATLWTHIVVLLGEPLLNGGSLRGTLTSSYVKGRLALKLDPAPQRGPHL